VDLEEYLGRIRDLHLEPFRQARIHLIVPEGPSSRVLIDPNRMQRVIDNLLGNARDVSGVGDHVWLEWECDEHGARIRVRDEGPGIAPEIAETLFEPFVTAGKQGGSGLGLAISRKIVDDHGAEIGVSGNADRGTSFVITLPRKLLVQPGELRTREGAVS
jgi:signal transduction histidine kinase